MDFGLSDEQRLLEDNLRRFLADAASLERVRAAAAREDGRDDGLWQGLAGLGALGVLVPEAHGGSGLGLLDAVVVASALGRAVAPAPFLGSAVMAPVALSVAATPAQQKEWLPRIATGTLRVGIAAEELFDLREGAGLRLEGGRLVGTALFVLDGEADAYLVPVEGTGLAFVPRAAAGLAVAPLRTVDRTRRFVELSFAGVTPEWVGGRPDAAAAAIARMVDAGRVAVAADLLGASESALTRSVAYAQQRVQFGRPIGSFQAVKHLCAEMAAELEPARALVWHAAHAFDAIPEEAPLLAAHAKAHLAEVGRFVVRTATEVHGGIGFTEEGALHLWFKRVGVDRELLGSPERAREDAARLQGWT